MYKVTHNLLVVCAIICDATRVLGTFEKMQFAVGVFANIVHIHTVMWQNEGI